MVINKSIPGVFIVILLLTWSASGLAMAPRPAPPPVPMELVRAAYDPEVGAVDIEWIVPNVEAVGPLDRLELLVLNAKGDAVFGALQNLSGRCDPVPPGAFGVVLDPTRDDRSIQNVASAGQNGDWDQESPSGILLEQSVSGIHAGTLGIAFWPLWGQATRLAIGSALMLAACGIVRAGESDAAPATIQSGVSEETLIEALNATATGLGWNARADVTRTTGLGPHTILQVFSGGKSFDITLYESLDQAREAHALGFAGKENRPFDFHGCPAVEAVYPAGSRGPIHGVMIQMGRANFRVIVPQPKSPGDVREIAEMFYRHAVESGILKGGAK